MRLAVKSRSVPTVLAALNEDHSVTAAGSVFRGPAIFVGDDTPIDFLAIAPADSNLVAPYPHGFSPVPAGTLLQQLIPPPADAVPILISRRNVVPGTHIGDHLTMRVGVATVPVEVRDIIEDFPTLKSPFVVADLTLLQPYLTDQLTALPPPSGFELWLGLDSTRPVSAAALVDRLALPAGTTRPEPISDAAALLDQYSRHLLSRQILAVFRLNVVILLGLSFTALLMLQLLDGWRRLPSFGAIRSLGVSAQGITTLLLLEGAALTLVGLAVGLLLGPILARLTLPLLAVTLSASLGGSTAAPLIFNWFELARLTGAMAALYLLGVALPAVAIGRLDVARRLRWLNT